MRKRNNFIGLRLTDKELDTLNEKARCTGLNRESYLRSLISGYTPKELPSADYLAMAKQLHALSNNVNQVAARANATGFFMVKEYEQYMNDVCDAIARIERAILEPERH